MTDKQALDLYEEVTQGSVAGMDDEEIHLVVDSVRRVRSATSEAEAMSAILWMGHNEEWTNQIVSGIRK